MGLGPADQDGSWFELRLGVVGPGEMFGALKGRLTDPNKNLIVLTMTTIGALATAMGPAVDKASRGIVGDVLRCLSDPKRQMREAVLKTLDAWVSIGALDKLLPYLAAALLDAKVGGDGRKELLEWTSKQMETAPPTLELHLLLKPVAASFQVRFWHPSRLPLYILVWGFSSIGLFWVLRPFWIFWIFWIFWFFWFFWFSGSSGFLLHLVVVFWFFWFCFFWFSGSSGCGFLVFLGFLVFWGGFSGAGKEVSE